MTEEKFRAEILLGLRNWYSDGQPMNYGPELTYTLIINGKFVGGSKMPEGDQYIKRQAKEYATKLKELNVSDYKLTNGERIRFTDKSRIKVQPMPSRQVQIFKNTLDNLLGYGDEK